MSNILVLDETHNENGYYKTLLKKYSNDGTVYFVSGSNRMMVACNVISAQNQLSLYTNGACAETLTYQIPDDKIAHVELFLQLQFVERNND